MMHVKKKQKSFLENTLEIIGLLLLVFLIRTFGFGLYQVPSGSMETTLLVGERFFADKFSYLFREPKHGDVISFNEPPVSFNYSDNKLVNLFQRYVWGPSNWTKRIIGMPGDEVRGVIEDGAPVVYLNGKKLDEPYLNKYPLIHMWSEDPTHLIAYAQAEQQRLVMSGVEPSRAQKIVAMELARKELPPRSYDPSASYEDQPFYRIHPELIRKNAEGMPELLWPGTPQYSQYGQERIAQNRNYWDGSDEFYVKLGSDEYWAMGDNRLGSKDCRAFGPIQRKLIHGKIVLRIWSLDSDHSWWILDLISHPVDFWKRMRWSRFFQWVK